MRWIGLKGFSAAGAVLAMLSSPLGAEEPALENPLALLAGAIPAELPNLTAPTFGGLQYWNDERVLGDWRIQRNVLTGHHRLLDGEDHRQAWGQFSDCEKALDAAREQGKAVPARGEVVVVLHGLGSGRWAMHPVSEHLRANGFDVVEVGYSTTSGTVADHAKTLAAVLKHLPEAEKIHFVAHSLGNIVVRHYLADTAEVRDPRLGRMVMLAPPNHGSDRARLWAKSSAVVRTLGPAVKELGPDWNQLEPRLATPADFAIISGGLENEIGFNLTIDGDDDGTLSIAETHLDGAMDEMIVPVLHSLIMYRQDVLDATTAFLRDGHLQAE